jgi:hypothetical protein
MAFNPHTAALALHRFVIIPQLLRNNALESLTKSVVQDVKAGRMNSGDAMVSSAFTAYAHPLSEHLLLDLQPLIEDSCEKKLFPTYSYVRLYTRGARLKKHVDRPACEYSVTINLASSSAAWPVNISNGLVEQSISLQPGDALLYKGCECPHWRDVLLDSWSLQVFLHYVDSKGPYAAHRFDGRESLQLLVG